MITNLSIKNYALIDDISVGFTSGFTIITGETGAGKSIVLGALSLLLGKRATLNSIKDVSKKCIIEGEFTLDPHQIESFFTSNNLDFDQHTIIRRELLPTGKSRAFVNDTPVTLSQLQVLAPSLIDVHSQHETLDLFSETFQLEVIDVLAGNTVVLTKYTNKLIAYNSVTKNIEELRLKKQEALKELDYNTFLFAELSEVDLKNIHQKDLEELYETLNNSEEIQESLSYIIKLFSEEQIGTLETIKDARLSLGKLRGFSSEFEDFWNRLTSVIIELEDIAEGLQLSSTSIEANPSLLFEVNSKLQALYKLQHKHAVASVSELIKIQETLASEIEITNNFDNDIDLLSEKQEVLRKGIVKLATKIHSERIKVIPILKKKLVLFLKELGLPNASFKFDITTSENFKKNGTNHLKLLFTANKGMAFGPLNKVASGGELSRIMLAIKGVLAQYKKLPTLVFDEIDTGVSGDVALKLATILQIMSETMQLICITHLPQIAASGNHHIKVYKEDINNVTITQLKVLSKEERVAEIAEMIGGKTPTKTAIKQAKELLN